MQAFRIAFKNVLRNSRRSLLLGSAIAFGFFILTFTNGFTSGLSSKVKDNFADSLGGHMYISGGEISSSAEDGKRGAWLPVIRNRQWLGQVLQLKFIYYFYVIRVCDSLSCYLSYLRINYTRI